MNWGRTILLIILLFCSFLIYSVTKINRTVRTDLITQVCADNLETCEHRYIAMQNARKDKSFRVAQADPFIVVELPRNNIDKHIVGEILFYCTYDATFDKRLQVQINGNNQQIIPRSWLEGKAYVIKINWKDHNEWHYDEKYIFLN
jgi:hypothetical protein